LRKSKPYERENKFETRGIRLGGVLGYSAEENGNTLECKYERICTSTKV
jgi:hypothetical protein